MKKLVYNNKTTEKLSMQEFFLRNEIDFSLVAYRLALKEFTAGQGKDDHVEDASKVLDGIQTTEVDQSSETKLSTADLEIIQNMLMNHSFQSFNVSGNY